MQDKRCSRLPAIGVALVVLLLISFQVFFTSHNSYEKIEINHIPTGPPTKQKTGPPTSKPTSCSRIMEPRSRSKAHVIRIGLSETGPNKLVMCAVVEALVDVYTDRDTDVDVVLCYRNGSVLPLPGRSSYASGLKIDLLVGDNRMAPEFTDFSDLPVREVTDDDKARLAAHQATVLWRTKGLVMFNSSSANQKRDNPPFSIAFSGEAWDRGPCRWNLLLVANTRPSFHGCPQIYWPSAVRFMEQRETDTAKQLVLHPDFNPEHVVRSKSFFALLLTRDCWHWRYGNNQNMIRTIMYHMLTEYKPVYALGWCKPKTRHRDFMVNSTYIASWGGPTDGPVNIYRNFKFVITFENTQVPGYFTEKLVNGILANSVPLYWGDPNITSGSSSFVNADRFISCKSTPEDLKRFADLGFPINATHYDEMIQQGMEIFRESFKPCIQEVIALDSNDVWYKLKLKHPFLPNNKVEGSIFDKINLARSIKEMATLSGVHPRVE